MTPTPCAQVPVHPREGRLWANVRPVGSETPLPSYPLDDLFDQAAIDSAVAAERERLRGLVEAVRHANAESYPEADAFLLPTPGQSRAWLALLAGLEAP